MSQRERELLEEVADLLATEEYRGHRLHSALQRLYRHHLSQQERLERLVTIADGFQKGAQQDLQETRQQLERQHRRQHKLSRIADGFQDLLHERNQALRDVSRQDPLTGLANRRCLHERLEGLTVGTARQSGTLSLVMLDIDHFKAVNDCHGHVTGDRVLVTLAKHLMGSLRQHDMCGRWGGEEFLLVLPETPLDKAHLLVQRLTDQLRDLRIPADGDTLSVFITASAGIAEWQPGEGYQATIERADRALLAAKRQGRDRCCLAEA
ncbi:biofilm regulation diguanylate cyclase SiaD [Halomonas marinisediminis]|uniref:diguanylate cyclase n=1 Tax=Halomonas marinisediminis TaxID=2546095 RepID=A0ABY2DA80_9GAMM|nr:biofilm regulation diguanylate cyclase SiaD [Halomonas marinisediminis]TDB05074.1 diguanylate cyclase [Halomonas marinisediminis]